MNFVDRMIGLLGDVSGLDEIMVASDFDEARCMLAQDQPDFVLLDINLPGKNGIELLRLIKKNTATCKVIMITNHADDYYRDLCYELGAMHFLDKSNDFALVPGIISQQISV